MMKGQQETEKIAINSWIDLLSGESDSFACFCMSCIMAVEGVLDFDSFVHSIPVSC